MSQSTNATESPNQRPILWISVISLGVLGLGLLAVVSYFFREFAVHRQMENYYQENSHSNKSFEQKLRQSTPTEGTVAWSKIGLMCDAGFDQMQTFSRLLHEKPSLGEESVWQLEKEKLEAELGLFLDEMKPLVDLIHESSQVAMPVWQPLKFDGLNANSNAMQFAWRITQLLSLEFYQAIKNSDSERALAVLQSIEATAAAFDWEINWTYRYQHLQHFNGVFHWIQKSLSSDCWNADQITQIMAILNQPLDPPRSWKVALVRSTISSLVEPALPSTMSYLLTAEERLELYKQYESRVSVGDVPLERMRRQAQSHNEKMLAAKVSGSITFRDSLDCIFPGAEHFLSLPLALEKMESERRMTLTAVAIKRFQMEQKRWPQNLEELAQVGLTIDDWTIPGLGNLGYEVTPAGATVFKFRSELERHRGLPLLLPPPKSFQRHPNATYDEVLIR